MNNKQLPSLKLAQLLADATPAKGMLKTLVEEAQEYSQEEALAFYQELVIRNFLESFEEAKYKAVGELEIYCAGLVEGTLHLTRVAFEHDQELAEVLIKSSMENNGNALAAKLDQYLKAGKIEEEALIAYGNKAKEVNAQIEEGDEESKSTYQYAFAKAMCATVAKSLDIVASKVEANTDTMEA